MNWLSSAVIFCLGVSLGFWGAVLKLEANMFLAIFFSILTALLFVIWGILKLRVVLWPGRDSWYASSSYEEVTPENNPQKAIDKDRRKQWRSSLPQKQGELFQVDMGKCRMIAGIEFTPDDSWIEKPDKWRMFFYGEQHRILGHKDGKGLIVVEGKDIPKYIQSFAVEIQEPALDMPYDSNYAKRNNGVKVYWTISYIKVFEYRFNIFGKRFCEREL